MTKVRMPISQFKAACTQVLREVAMAEKTIEVTNHGKVVAVVTPPSPTRKNGFWGSMRGTTAARDDLVAPAIPASEWNASQSR